MVSASIIAVGITAHLVAQSIAKTESCGDDSVLSFNDIPSYGWLNDSNAIINCIDKIRSFLEKQSTTHTILFICSDAGGACATVLNCLHESFPSIIIFFIYIPVFSAPTTALESINEILTFQLALHYSQLFTIKSIQDTLHFIESRKEKDVSLSLCCDIIASDIIPLLYYMNPTVLSSTPTLPISSYNKCCDIRSSLWRNNLTAKPIEGEPNKMKDISISLHDTYRYTLHPPNEKQLVACALLSVCKDKGRLAMVSSFPCEVINEAKICLEWATPKLQYSNIKCSTSRLASSTVFMCLIYESPFIKARLNSACTSVRLAVSQGAYVDVFRKERITEEDILDAVSAVETYCRH